MTQKKSQLNGKCAMVTGASGFIGSHLCEHLRLLGAEVHALSRSAQTQCDGMKWWKLDLTDRESVRGMISAVQPDYIFHLASHVVGSRSVAAVIPTLENNLLSSVNLMIAAAEIGTSKVVFAGSLEEPSGQNPFPQSPYAASKWAVSVYTRMFQVLYGLKSINLRIGMVYGPGQADTSKLVPHVINSLLSGESPKLSSGHRRVDWIYVDDVVPALIAAANTLVDCDVSIDIGTGIATSVREVVSALHQLVNPSIELRFGELPDRPFDADWVAEMRPALDMLHWQPQVRLDAGLMATVDWYRRLRLTEMSGALPHR